MTTCSDFPSEAMLWVKEVEMVDSFSGMEVIAIRFWKEFSKFWDAGRRRLNMLWTRSSRIRNSRRGTVSRNRKPKKRSGFCEEDRSLTWSTPTFRVTGAHDTVLDYAGLFSVSLHGEYIQEFDTRWDEVLLSMSKIPSDDILESLYQLRTCESAQL